MCTGVHIEFIMRPVCYCTHRASLALVQEQDHLNLVIWQIGYCIDDIFISCMIDKRNTKATKKSAFL